MFPALRSLQGTGYADLTLGLDLGEDRPYKEGLPDRLAKALRSNQWPPGVNTLGATLLLRSTLSPGNRNFILPPKLLKVLTQLL